MNKRHLKNYLSTASGRTRALTGLGRLAIGGAVVGGAAHSNYSTGGVLSKLKKKAND